VLYSKRSRAFLVVPLTGSLLQEGIVMIFVEFGIRFGKEVAI